MNYVDLKERIAISDAFTPEERDFLLDAINGAQVPHVVAVHAPGNYLGRIEAMFAVLSVDAGGEGLVAAPMGNLTMPLVCTDRRRLETIVPVARAIAHALNVVCRLTKFTKREDLEIYQP